MSQEAGSPGLAEAVEAHLQLVALMNERRGRGLDVQSLLALRHLSRTCSFRCPEAASMELTVALEDRAAELYAESIKERPELEFLERRIDKLLGALQAVIARHAALDPDQRPRARYG